MYDHETHETEYRNRGTVDGSYRYVRPESKEMLYRDANIEPAEEAARMPRHYIPAQKTEKEEPAKEKAPDIAPPDVMKGFWKKAICMCMVCALLGGLIGGGITAALMHNNTPAALDSNFTDDSNNESDESGSGAVIMVTPVPTNLKSPGQIYEDACTQVVGITTEVSYHNMFGMTVSQPVSGSGFFISEDGYVLTNYHVIEYAAEYGSTAKVITHDGTEYTASVVGCEPDNDIAVLQVDASGLPFAKLGNSDGIRVGDNVYAVGNPLGELQFSMTTGSISATNRRITTQESAPAINMFQIDAAVNHGNSGGPVYDNTGEVIGIVTAKYSDEGIEGIGFAIPINDAVAIAKDLITTGYVTGKAKLGVDAQTMSSRAAMYYNSVEGAYIRYIEAGSCADTAGLMLGDVIYRFGDLDVSSRDELQAAIRSYHAGDTVELGVFRNQKHLTVMVTLDEDIPENVTQPTPGPVSYSHYSSPF